MILIVDDRQENLFSLQKLLELNQFTVDTATSGEEALRKILKNTYLLIILDVQMPDMDGFEVAEAITGYSKSKDIPIIFLSAVNTEKRFITKGYSSGAIDYIIKPFDPDILLLKVKTFYRLQMQARELTEIHNTLRKEIEFRKQAEVALQQNIQELISILESIPQVAFTFNAEGQIEFVNKYWYQYSYSQELLPQTAPGTLSMDDCLQQAIAGGKQMESEISIRPLGGDEYRFHLFSMTPVKKDTQISKWIGMLTDIHEQRMANQLLEQRVVERTQALQDANRELEVSNHDLQQFAYVASHDLKEPLRKIQVFSHLIKEKYLSDKPESVTYIDRIIRSSERMTSLIRDVLDYSELSIADSYSLTDLNAIINDIIVDMELLIQEKGATIEVAPMPKLEVIPSQMRQLFQNMISNALKFSKPGTPPLVSISTKRIAGKSAHSTEMEDGSYCCIQITDNGIGFNEKYRDRIFAIFQRLHSREEFEGTGIGLAIVKRIVDRHNGSIIVNSVEGEGSSFVIVLPVKQNGTVQ